LDRDELISTMEAVRSGALSVADAADRLTGAADLGFANVDLARGRRCGFPEVVFGQGKTAEQILAIVRRIAPVGAGCLSTRVEPDAARLLVAEFPTAVHDPVARTVWLPPGKLAQAGRVAVITAGTGDLPVAKEAVNTAVALGCETELIVDVGVAGLHRLLARVETLRRQHAVVVAAGMEGTLPSVVGGLVSCPVVAVPTSIGYGANFQGLAALLAMLSSCAANVTVVNIDAGFCGGYVAGLIARQSAVAET
jgi:hypothetical protein